MLRRRLGTFDAGYLVRRSPGSHLPSRAASSMSRPADSQGELSEHCQGIGQSRANVRAAVFDNLVCLADHAVG
jgi:hypothetical protein